VVLVAALGLVGLLVVPTVLFVLVPPLGVLSFLAVIPLAVFLWVRLLVVYQPLIMIEGLGTSLFRRSWELTRGHFWGLFGRSLLFGLIVGFATNLVTFPFQFIGAADPQLGTLLSFTVGIAAGAASGIVQAAGPIILYRDLVDGPPTPIPAPVWGAPPAG
jgi:ABC-type Fe3+ transport system permease subunit